MYEYLRPDILENDAKTAGIRLRKKARLNNWSRWERYSQVHLDFQQNILPKNSILLPPSIELLNNVTLSLNKFENHKEYSKEKGYAYEINGSVNFDC